MSSNTAYWIGTALILIAILAAFAGVEWLTYADTVGMAFVGVAAWKADAELWAYGFWLLVPAVAVANWKSLGRKSNAR